MQGHENPCKPLRRITNQLRYLPWLLVAELPTYVRSARPFTFRGSGLTGFGHRRGGESPLLVTEWSKSNELVLPNVERRALRLRFTQHAML